MRYNANNIFDFVPLTEEYSIYELPVMSAVGKALNTLLRAVMEGRLPNEKAALLAALEKEGLL